MMIHGLADFMDTMATTEDQSPSSSQPSRDPLTSCPQCGSLCLGPTILPCGHMLCRRCLHDVLHAQGPGTGCPQCGHCLCLAGDQPVTINQLVQQMGTDPVMEQLVLQELEKETNIPCLVCPNKQAVNVCLDCQEHYCEQCSDSHRKVRVSKDHLLHQLPQSLQGNPSAIPVAAPTSRRSLARSASSVDSLCSCDDPQPHDLSCNGLGSVGTGKDWVLKQVGLLQHVSGEHQEVKTLLHDIVSLGQRLVNRLHPHQCLLDTYQDHLTRLDVIRCVDPTTYVINAPSSDVSMSLKVQPLERRLHDVRMCHQCPDVNVVKMVRTQLSQLLHSTEQKENPGATSMNPVMSATPSATHTPTSLPLSSPILSPVHPLSSTPFALPTEATTQTHILTLNMPPPAPSTFPMPSPLISSPTLSTPTVTPPSLPLLPQPPTPICNGPTTPAPQRVFTSSPKTADDEKLPGINAILCLSEDRLVLSDFNNRKVKVVRLESPYSVSACLRVSEPPWDLAQLPDSLVAMTTKKPVIYVLKVTDSVTEVSRIQTLRQYDGISGHSEGYLIVSCLEGDAGPAAVDVLTREGNVIASFKHGSGLTVQLKTPHYLCQSADHHVLLSDSGTHQMYEIDANTGQVTQTLHDKDLRYPRQMCVDNNGRVFVACVASQCVLVRERDGQWKKLLTSARHSDPGYQWPVGLCLTSTGQAVVTWYKIGYPQESVVICYKFT